MSSLINPVVVIIRSHFILRFIVIIVAVFSIVPLTFTTVVLVFCISTFNTLIPSIARDSCFQTAGTNRFHEGLAWALPGSWHRMLPIGSQAESGWANRSELRRGHP